jgi:hypothetical membrane protein
LEVFPVGKSFKTFSSKIFYILQNINIFLLVKRILLEDDRAMGWAIGILSDPSLFAANAGR